MENGITHSLLVLEAPKLGSYFFTGPKLFAELKETHSELLDRCDHAMFDKGYDSTDRICGECPKSS